MYANLSNLMRTKKITQDDIAEKIGVSRGTVGNKITGKTGCGFGIEEALEIKDEFFPAYDLRFLFEKDNFV